VPEETTPPQGTPSTPEAPSIDWDSPDNPYLKRFQDTQASYTQNQQELARLKAYEDDPNAFLELGKGKGWIEYEEPTPEPGVDPRLAQTQQELADMRQWREQVEAERQAERTAAGEELFHQDLDGWAEKDGVKLSQADHNAIFGMLMRAPDPTQESAARQVYEAHVAHKKAEREQWEQEYQEARRRPRVPTAPMSGDTHTGTPDWSGMSEEQINEYLAARIAGTA
jgi:hypothetical protein